MAAPEEIDPSFLGTLELLIRSMGPGSGVFFHLLLLHFLVTFVMSAFAVFWMWMLVDCYRTETKMEQIRWMFLVIFAGPIGGAIYFSKRVFPRARAGNAVERMVSAKPAPQISSVRPFGEGILVQLVDGRVKLLQRQDIKELRDVETRLFQNPRISKDGTKIEWSSLGVSLLAGDIHFVDAPTATTATASLKEEDSRYMPKA